MAPYGWGVSASATTTAVQPCEHGEPRGCTSCALCRRCGCEVCQPCEVDGESRVFALRLPVHLHEALKRRARADDRRMAQTVRVALRAYLAS